MAVLLDTCVLIWAVDAPDRISASARALLEGEEELLIASISAYEVSNAIQKGRIRTAQPARKWFVRAVEELDARVVDLTWPIAMQASELPSLHGDGFDRIIVATAVQLKATLISPDKPIHDYRQFASIAW